MKVYISGKIGEEVISEATRQKFAKAEEMLKAKGYEVFNPCDERWQRTLNWDNSPGAQSEHSFAMATGKKLLWERLEDALVFHDDNEKPEDIWLPLE